ncbi:MAG: hypothetical protein PHC99_05840 [Methylococcales bacterium]|nr:hypothetical protein [Methylococcales bacterium]
MKKYTLTTASAVLGLAALFSAEPVFATEQIAYALFGASAYIDSCSTCHSGNPGWESKGNLKAGVSAAYQKDKWGLSGLRTFVATSVTTAPTCTNGQVLNTATNTCDTPAPTCTNGQVLNTTTNTCVTPVPTCTNGQVLNAAKTACITPTPTCVSPQVLNTTKTACETPTPTCTNGQVLNAATNTCVTPVPVCKSPQVLNSAKTACVTPATTTTPPTCVSPQVLNAAQTACVTPSSTTTNTKPVLNAVAKQWDATVGELFTIPLSVNDAEQDEFTILLGKVAGAKLSAVHPDAAGLPSIDFEWTPTAVQANKIFTITFQAKETKTTQKLASNKVSVKVRVWAAGSRNSASVKTFTVTTSKFANGALNLSGKVTLNSILTAAEKKDFLAQKFDLTVSDKNGVLIGTVPLMLDASGNWAAKVPASSTTCDIVLQYEGKNAARTVVGCTNSTAAITTPVTVANNSSNNPFSSEDGNEHDDHNENQHDNHDD